jgi:Tol biopolymer transport system component
VLNDMARVMGFEVTPDGQRVLFWAGSSSAGLTHRLFSTRPDGSTAPVLLSPSLDQYSVSMVRTLTSDGTKVVFVAQITAALAGLFVAPVDGSTPTQPLPTPPYSAFGIAKFNPDPDTVYFSTKDPAVGVNRLYRVPIDGSSSPLLLADLSPLGATSLAVSHDGSTLLFVADDRPNSLSELYSLPTSGGAITRLSPALTSSLQVNQSWVTETDRALFTIGGSDWGELFSVPLDGSEASVSLSPGRRATLGGRTPYVASLAPVLTSSAVVFAADSGPWTPDQLFASAIDASSAPVELTPEVTPGPSDRDVAVTVLLTPDGQHALYSVDQEINDVEYLYSVALTPPYEVHQLTDFEAFASLVTPDSARVLFSTGSQLYSVRVDGSEAPIPLGAPGAILGFELTPDGQRVVYLQSDRLYVVPVDGSLAPYPLDPFDRALRAKGQFRVNPNGLSVVYVAALSGGDTRARLFHLSLDGSTNPKHLSGTFQSQGNLSFLPDSGRFQLSPDGSRVVYWGDLVVDGRTDLYSSPVEGSTGRLTLVTPGVPDSTLRDDFRISPDSTRLVYRADSDVVNRVELFSVRLDGVGGVVKLSPTLAPRRDVHPSLSFTPDGSQVIYVSDQDADIRGPAGMSSRSRPALELYRVPIDGSGPSVRLSGPLLRGEGIRSSNTGSVFAVDPVNERVVYLLELASGNARRWMSAPLDGSRAAVPLSPALKQAAAYLLDDGDLVFAEGTGRLGRFNLYRASTLGTSPALRLNSPADTVQGFYGATVFRGDLEAPERDELFLYPLGP